MRRKSHNNMSKPINTITMQCATIHTMMWQKAENRLPEAMVSVLNQHLTECPACASLKQQIDALHSVVTDEKNCLPDARFVHNVMTQIDTESLPHRSLNLWQGRGYKTLLAASIAFAIAFGSTTALLLSTTSSTTATSEEMAYLNDSSIEGMDTWFSE